MIESKKLENHNVNHLRRKLKLSLKHPLSDLEKRKLLQNLKMGTVEWAKKNINCIKGCKVNCIYCYAKGMAKQYKRCNEYTWQNMEINWAAVTKNYGRIKRIGKQPYDIMFPTTHNIFIEEPYFFACVHILNKCLKAGNTVLITIKPFFKVVRKLCEIFYYRRRQMAFRFTIGSVNSNILKMFEMNGPSYEERIESVEYATESDFSTTISIEPLLDLKPDNLIKELAPKLSKLNYEKDQGTIWIGLLKKRYIPVHLRVGDLKEYLNVIDPPDKEEKFNNVYSYYEKYYNHPRIKWKESIKKLMILNDIKVKDLTLT